MGAIFLLLLFWMPWFILKLLNLFRYNCYQQNSLTNFFFQQNFNLLTCLVQSLVTCHCGQLLIAIIWSNHCKFIQSGKPLDWQSVYSHFVVLLLNSNQVLNITGIVQCILQKILFGLRKNANIVWHGKIFVTHNYFNICK